MAAYESQHKAEGIRSAHRQIAERGGWKGGIRCFGYEGGRDDDGELIEGGGVTIREDEPAEIRRIADTVVHGQSLRSPARELNERGIKTVKG